MAKPIYPWHPTESDLIDDIKRRSLINDKLTEMREVIDSVKHSIENCKLDNHGVLLGDELEEKIMNFE